MTENGLAQTPATPTETPKTDTPPGNGLSSTPFSQLAKKEQELVRKRQEFKKEQEKFASERQESEEIKKKVAQFQETKQKDPVAAMKLLGFSETDIFNFMAANDKKDPTPEERAAQIASQAAEARIKAFEDAQAKKAAESETARVKQLVAAYRGDLNKAVTANPERFKYVADEGREAIDQAYHVAIAHAEMTNGAELMKIEEALDIVEEYMREADMAKEHLRNRPPSKAPEPEKAERSRTVNPPEDPSYQPKPTITRQRTLTNAATAVGTKPRAPETREQKKARLADMLRKGTI
jgi:hypothetical protein